MRNGKLTRLAKILVFIFAFAAAAPAFAAGLSEYRTKIEDVTGELGFLLSHDESETEAHIRAEERDTLKSVRATLPPTETVEMRNARFEVDHGWIFARLKAFEEEPVLAKRQQILTELVEQLEAVQYKLEELEKQEAATRTKDEDKQKLREILNRPEYQKPEEKKKTWVEQALDDFFKWLSNLFPAPSPVKETETSAVQPLSLILQFVLYLLVIGIIGFLLYRFAPLVRQKFLNRRKTEKKERVILGEKLAADETAHNLFSEAERLAREGNLRAAIRKGYIALLCELSDRKIIGLANHKTNRDYLRDVRKRPELYRNMNALTNNFETVWYGFGKAETEDWEKFREKYKETVNNRS